MDARLSTALDAIDRLHAEDPSAVEVGGEAVPEELAYAQRMTSALNALVDSPSAELRLAVRAQHLCRWRLPRSEYPKGRKGYLRWRTDAALKHAALAASVLRGAGYSDAEIDRVSALIQKRQRRADPEAQALEDAACLVFLEHEVARFADGRESAQVLDILRKAWKRMSPEAQERARSLPSAKPWLEAAGA